MPERHGVAFSLYMVACRDGSLYTGIARDVDARLEEHRRGSRGARYLRGRGPLRLVFQEVVGSQSRALQLEHRVKKLPRRLKLKLVAGELSLGDLDG